MSDPNEDLLKTRKVRITILTEAVLRAPLDPSRYDVRVRSLVDPWFDMNPESVTIEVVPS